MVRTRFAPSPTGYMHIGNLRTALYAYLTARNMNGKFILRIEDTDQERNVPEAVAAIYRSLDMAGLEYDEGPDKDGGYGPYVQSERLDIYKEYGNRLLEMGAPTTAFVKDPQHSDERFTNETDPCRFLNQKEVQEKLGRGKLCHSTAHTG